ncbi:MAG: formylmethanofuran--tetrahydromethanopterin N-formyltransferase [Euryarchaeota archaeon]|nr:formylmethanofuran--tetrahydromethanopterin N-formyltransferase [Euryarchaeota archaeon]
MRVNGVEIEDTFAEAFDSWYSRFVITAVNERWARTAAAEATGFGTSLIACTAEAGIERMLGKEETPDSRPGCAVMVFAPKKKLAMELIKRIGQCVLTAPTTRVFALGEGEEIDVGFKLKYFGDGYEELRNEFGREMVVVPIMMGEFMIERNLTMAKGVAGGNFIILASSVESALTAAERAVEAISEQEGTITPFPGGIVASGSKVGSKKYKFMPATTNERFCPTLKDRVEDSALDSETNAVAEVVIDGTSASAVAEAMRLGIEAATQVEGVRRITAGNYGGNLGKHKIYLNELF